MSLDSFLQHVFTLVKHDTYVSLIMIKHVCFKIAVSQPVGFSNVKCDVHERNGSNYKA